MYLSGVEINYITVIDELKNRGVIEGSSEFFAIFDEGEIFSKNWKSYLKVIKQNSLVRKFNLEVSQGVDLREASKRLQEGLRELEELENDDEDLTLESFKDLLRKELPKPKFIVEDILPEGFSILAGLPKAGKSRLALNIAIAVASGGKALGCKQCQKMGVLYLALEDREKRLQERGKEYEEANIEIPDWLFYKTNFPKGEEGIRKIEKLIKKYDHIGLVIIDTLANFLNDGKKKNINPYLDDYSKVSPLLDLCKNYNVSILAIHHRRKTESDDDWTLNFSGTTGLTAVADTLLYLKAKRGDYKAILYVDGRDMSESLELMLERDEMIGGFRIIGNAEEVIESEYKKAIIEYLKDVEKAKPKEIAENTGLKLSMVYLNLNRLVEDGLVRKEGRGEYSIKKEDSK